MPLTRHHHAHPAPMSAPQPTPARPPAPSPITTPSPTPTPTPTPTAATYTFDDEFVGAAGSPPNPANWTQIVGQGSVVGGNDETEIYVNSTQNAYLDGNGHLVIAVTNAPGGRFNSARLTSTFSQLYGSWEASIALDNVPGCWPAFWFLGKNGSWPGCGEADLMENYGTGFTEGTIWNSTASANKNGRATSSVLDGAFHLYRIDSSPGSIAYSYDGVEYASATSADLTPWPFDSNGGLYCLLNIATSGTGTNGVNPSASAMPAKMTVDYVHAWT